MSAGTATSASRPRLRRLRRVALGVAALLVAGSPVAAADPATEVATRALLLDAQRVGPLLVAVGLGGHILRSADNGASWELTPTPTRAVLTGVCFPDPQHGWAVGHDAVILHTEDGGRTWTKQYQGTDLQVSFLDVHFLDAQTGYVVGAYGQFLATADGGRTWTPRTILTDDYFLNRISAAADGTLYLAGEHGTLLRSSDHGETWQPIRTTYDGSFYGILPLGGARVLAHGLRGSLFLSEDRGDTWQAVPQDQRVLFATAVRLRSGVIVVAGQARSFAVSRDDGRTFAPWSPGLTTGVAELVEAPDGTLLAFGEAGVSRLPAP